MKNEWKDVDYQFKTESPESVTAAAPNRYEPAPAGLVTATIVTTDGRRVEALVHQGSRSVYPKKVS